MSYPLPLTRTEAYLAYKAGVIQQSELKPSLAVPRIGIDAWLAYWTQLANDYPKNPDGTPMILQEEEAYIAYLCGVIDAYPENCYRRVGAYLRYIISARWGRPDHPLNREELYLSLIKTQFIPSGDPSSDIEIDGTTKAPFVDVKLYGDTFQQSYTGKNLVGLTNNTVSRDGLTATVEGDTVTIDGTATGSVVSLCSANFNLTGMAGEKPAVSIFPISGSWTGGAIGFSLRDSSNAQVFFQQSKYDGQHFNTNTLTESALASADHAFIFAGATTVFSNFKFKIMLSDSPVIETTYEPFVGGIPSPNPDYPQPIQTVTGTQTVEVVGINLCSSAWESGDYNTTTGTKGTGSGYRTADYIAVEPSTTYIVSRNGAGVGMNVLRYDANKNYLNSSTISSGNSFTTASNVAYITMYRGTTGGIANMQLQKGSTITAYTPYNKQTLPISLGSIELCKLGTYQDYIWKDGEDWKVHKETGTVAANAASDKTWIKSGQSTSSVFVAAWTNMRTGGYVHTLDDRLLAQSFAYSNTTTANTGRFDRNVGSTEYDYLLLRFDISVFNTLDKVKTWLNNNPQTVYYSLATPTDTTITDTNLIAQLDSLVNGGAENGTTYIKVSATDPNLPGLLYVEAPKYE